LKGKVEVGIKCEITFLSQHLGLSIFYPNWVNCLECRNTLSFTNKSVFHGLNLLEITVTLYNQVH